ncbi:hypothetical protein [Corallococcus aberystwythensis]|uniref:Uncharacterized protein n=1 Tax=Corallococcus aberystwythensis TaxID=2316722 RepID=A0A3A8QRS9_9BACT|nr:hypothetical protein [Corallococcus aberystwythensis]RKH67582.1 hypothetical protein D7W81_13780 [Corallococcus aberystwythensis]
MKINPAVLIIAGGFSLFFLVSGVRALVRKRMTVVNPAHSGAWPGLLGKAMHSQLPKNPFDPHPSMHMEATGGRALGMAVLYIVLGVAFLGLGIFATLVENDVL